MRNGDIGASRAPNAGAIKATILVEQQTAPLARAEAEAANEEVVDVVVALKPDLLEELVDVSGTSAVAASLVTDGTAQ